MTHATRNAKWIFFGQKVYDNKQKPEFKKKKNQTLYPDMAKVKINLKIFFKTLNCSNM